MTVKREWGTLQKMTIIPGVGKVLIFIQRGWYDPLHAGAPHTSKGKYKYIIRSDLVHERVWEPKKKKKEEDGRCLPWENDKPDITGDSYDDPLSLKNRILL